MSRVRDSAGPLALLVVFMAVRTVEAQPATAASTGQSIYTRDCATCHGATGKGDGETAAYLTPQPQDLTTGILKKQTDQFLTSVIANGGKPNGLSESMPPFPKLSKSDLKSVVAFIRQLAKGTSGQPKH